ncbi:hypothetical protein J3R83DRAFT_7864 [Lanmaoa asiatica]|nr:hypothetical protein J3R83DRAFT_7864 [Lanmaoa asiatica]
MEISSGICNDKDRMPEAEEKVLVKDVLGAHYKNSDSDRRPTFKAVTDAESDGSAAIYYRETSKPSNRNSRTGLKRRNLIFGEPLTLDEFLEPAEEQEVGRSFQFEGGDEAIVAAVRQEMAEKQGQVIEVDSDDEDEDMEPEPEMSRAEILALCQKLESACLQLGDATPSVSLDFGVTHSTFPCSYTS